MKGTIVDASVTAAWLLDDEVSATADWVLEQMQAGATVAAPSLWLLEVTSAVYNAERRKRINRRHRDAALKRIEQMPIALFAPPTLIDFATICRYADKHRLTPYDAEYLRIAKEQGMVLASLDKNLLAAAAREKVSVVG